ncbi:fimbrial biogenesis chaperone [Pseudomonas sp. HLT2-19-2]
MFFKERARSASHLLICGLGLIGAGHASFAADGVAANTSRIILNAQERNVATLIGNSSGHAALVRASISGSGANADFLPPFIAMPSLFRLWAGEERVIRIIRTPGALPADRESLFYLHTLETPIVEEGVPGVADQLEKVERIAFLYRPQHLVSLLVEAPRQLLWRLVNRGDTRYLRVTNPSPYHIAFAGLRVVDGQVLQELGPQHDLLAPSASRELPLAAHIRGRQVGVEFAVNDDKGLSTAFFRAEARL